MTKYLGFLILHPLSKHDFWFHVPPLNIIMYSNHLSSCLISTTEVRYFWLISNKRSVEHLKKKKRQNLNLQKVYQTALENKRQVVQDTEFFLKNVINFELFCNNSKRNIFTYFIHWPYSVRTALYCLCGTRWLLSIFLVSWLNTCASQWLQTKSLTL